MTKLDGMAAIVGMEDRQSLLVLGMSGRRKEEVFWIPRAQSRGKTSGCPPSVECTGCAKAWEMAGGV